MKSSILLPLLLAWSLFAATATATANDYTVVPGQSLGRVRLGASHTAVRKIWGRPYLIKRDGNYTIEFWRGIPQKRSSYKAAIFLRSRVIQLETDSPRFRTAQGLSVSSNLGVIRKRLGRMRVISFGLNDPEPDVADHASHYYDSVRFGLAFDLGLGYRPDLSASATPQALYVHRRGYRFINVEGKEVWWGDSPS